LFFSIIFFTQFILGWLVNEKFLMTGKLHLPVPALIIAGPIFRSGGFFMLILLLTTILLVGPAWCSHLCYIGAWDNLAAKNRKIQKPLSRKTILILRYVMLAFVVLIAIVLNLCGASGLTAAIFAISFGVLGILVMIFFSAKKGFMVHCTMFCPIGSFVTLLTKIYPIKVKIDKKTCTMCSVCTNDCKYHALQKSDLVAGKAGWNCTLCGDCIKSCKQNSIIFSFWGSTKNYWSYYIALVVAIHTVFIALARL